MLNSISIARICKQGLLSLGKLSLGHRGFCVNPWEGILAGKFQRNCYIKLAQQSLRKQALVTNLSCHFDFHKCSHQNKEDYSEQNETLTLMSIEDDVEEDEEYNALLKEHYFLPQNGHQILILQPVIRWGPRKPTLTNSNHQMAEAVALVDTLPNWKVVESINATLRKPTKRKVFGNGKFLELTQLIRSRREVSAVFVNVEMLTGLQLVTMQTHWKIPVYDRYTIVLQIFKVHATSREAKLQVALAEIPYFRSRLLGLHYGLLENSSLESIGGTGENYIQSRRDMLMVREAKIRQSLVKLRSHRHLLRQRRTKKELPIVAVVGYTNSGKTSLIKALTGEVGMEPKNQLFATLDVTAHSGLLPSRIQVLYMDTIGFISDIPTDLIEAFTATLEDALLADVIVHVRDVSHPDHVAQKAEVIRTLQNLNLSEEKARSVIEVANKCDKLSSAELETFKAEPCLMLSATSGLGLTEFTRRLEEAVLEATGLMVKKLKVPSDGPHLSWLYKQSTIRYVRSSDDGRFLLIDCIISKIGLDKFRAEFGQPKLSKTMNGPEIVV